MVDGKMQLQDLPNEILAAIVTCVEDVPTIWSCTMIKIWHHDSQKALYSNVYFSNLEQAQRFSTALIPTNAERICAIKVEGSMEPTVDEQMELATVQRRMAEVANEEEAAALMLDPSVQRIHIKLDEIAKTELALCNYILRAIIPHCFGLIEVRLLPICYVIITILTCPSSLIYLLVPTDQPCRGFKSWITYIFSKFSRRMYIPKMFY